MQHDLIVHDYLFENWFVETLCFRWIFFVPLLRVALLFSSFCRERYTKEKRTADCSRGPWGEGPVACRSRGDKIGHLPAYLSIC